MFSLPFWPNSGMYSAIGFRSRTLPCSTRIITLVAVAIGLVSDAMSNSVSTVIGSSDGSTPSIAVGLQEPDAAGAADGDDAAGEALGFDLGLDQGVDAIELLLVQAQRCGGDDAALRHGWRRGNDQAQDAGANQQAAGISSLRSDFLWNSTSVLNARRVASGVLSGASPRRRSPPSQSSRTTATRFSGRSGPVLRRERRRTR